MYTKLNITLQDMSPDEIFENKKFAQELELSNQVTGNIPNHADAHSCSSNIDEIDHLYQVEKEERLDYYTEVEDAYQYNFPI